MTISLSNEVIYRANIVNEVASPANCQLVLNSAGLAVTVNVIAKAVEILQSQKIYA